MVKVKSTPQSESSPTQALYTVLEQCFDYFNQRLFEKSLPQVILTVYREKRIMGYFASKRWASADVRKLESKKKTEKEVEAHLIDEIAINPMYFGNHSLVETFQTMVHEMCHLWQYKHGTPSRSKYHNQEWADKLESLGLIPSSTGLPGGKKTGQQMNDYPAANGPFIDACNELVKTGFIIPWVDRYTAYLPDRPAQVFDQEDWEPGDAIDIDALLDTPLTEIYPELFEIPEDELMAARAKNKVKYRCFECDINLWGKPNLLIICGTCGDYFDTAL